ncbi:MAG: SPOR domain-containing protein [Prevotella sp.]|nr:SPOR domain-containing protein [Prevotella sp.]
MIALERHIEILLLENDCVIVPDLGGFMAHYVEASYDGSEQLYLPPLRTLGFNPKLKMNDSLLAQSYVESYDISYPEAVTRIEKEVSEIKQQIENQGLYEIYDIGTLRLNKEGNYEFEPCEAGILTPGLYGLSALEISPIAQAPAISHKSAIVSTDAKEPTHHAPLEEEEKQEKGERTLHIKMSTVRKAVAVAAAVALLIVLAVPVGNESKSIIEKCMIDTDLFYRIMPKEITTNKPNELRSKKDELGSKKDDVSLREEEGTKDELRSEKEDVHQPSTIVHPTSEGTHQPSTINHQPSEVWTIVLASQVARKNAEAFVGKLKERGYTETEIIQRAKGIKVVFGHFETEAQAQNRLRTLRQESTDFAEAWTMRIDN